VVGLGAWLVSLGPGSRGCVPDSWIPACAVYRVLPMFRAYARFGFVTHLTVALLAGWGAATLAQWSRVGRAVALALLVAAAFGAVWQTGLLSIAAIVQQAVPDTLTAGLFLALAGGRRPWRLATAVAALALQRPRACRPRMAVVDEYDAGPTNASSSIVTPSPDSKP
jgi:hypothetical protein